MNDRSASANTGLAATSWALPVLLVLFVGSGCSALIYEIVWFQLLQLVIGSSAVSLGVLLGTFMGGMCLGSLLFPRLVSPRHHPLRVYALLEIGIGLIGLALLVLIPLVGEQYIGMSLGGFAGILLRGAVCAVCLLPPTMLMGATLPAISRWMETTPLGMSRLGFFYGANIAGAVFGCLLAGFYLLRLYDIPTATYVAAAINAAVALLGLAISCCLSYDGSLSAAAQSLTSPGGGPSTARTPWTPYVAIAISGMTALGAEVIWARLLSLMLGATVYTFSIILAVFLVGLGVGSTAGSVLSRGAVNPRKALGWCQLLLTAAIAWSAFMLTRSLPYWPVDVALSRSPWLSFQLDIARCAWALLPAACLWGASFPLALAAAAVEGRDAGKLVGGMYAANTVGAIVGAVAFSILVIGMFGTQRAQQALIGLSSLAALLMFVPLVWRGWREVLAATQRSFADYAAASRVTALAIGAAAAALLLLTVPPAPRGLIALGRSLPRWEEEPFYVYVGEGRNASIAVTETYDESSGEIVGNFHVSGKVVASGVPADMRLQRLLGHLPALLHGRPKSVLVVGCGAGVTAGSFVPYPEVEQIVICEIEPLIPPAAGKYFYNENHYVIDDKRVEVVLDDARHYVRTTPEKFDIITSDPIHPWVKGAAALYSKEYFEICKQHLKPGGIVTQWVPLYESNLEAVKSEIATFFEVFPDGTIWANDNDGEGYDIVLLGQVGATKFDVEAIQQRINSDLYVDVKQSLEEVYFPSAMSLAEKYAGRKVDLAPWLADAQLNYDSNLRLQYLAGLGLNAAGHERDRIYQAMLDYRKYPDDLFVASEEHERRLRRVLSSSNSSPPDDSEIAADDANWE